MASLPEYSYEQNIITRVTHMYKWILCTYMHKTDETWSAIEPWLWTNIAVARTNGTIVLLKTWKSGNVSTGASTMQTSFMCMYCMYMCTILTHVNMYPYTCTVLIRRLVVLPGQVKGTKAVAMIWGVCSMQCAGGAGWCGDSTILQPAISVRTQNQ